MRVFFRVLVYATLTLVLIMALVIGDLVFNGRRMLYAALGRDALVATCRPALASKLVSAGFEPDGIELGETPDITFSTASGKTLTDTFTFEDGASQARVDGLVVCGVKGSTVQVEVRTRTTPLRAT